MPARLVLIVAAVLLLGFAPAPLPRQQRQREDPNDLAGTWEFVLFERNGVRETESEERLRVEMTRDSFVFVTKQGGNKGARYVMRLDPWASPAAFALCVNSQVLFVGSYRLHRDEMTMILDWGGRLDDRPMDFGKRCLHRFVLRRVMR